MGPKESYQKPISMLTHRLGSREVDIDVAVREILKGPMIKDNNFQMIQILVQQLWNCTTDLEVARCFLPDRQLWDEVSHSRSLYWKTP